MDLFKYFNDKWVKYEIKYPLVILIGGHIGTGKSTFASLLAEKIKNINIISTGVIRAIYQSLLTREKFPELFYHSYNLYKLIKDHRIKKERASLVLFQKQIKIVQSGLNKIIAFAFSEKQHYIIEGNHITPQFTASIKNKFPIIGLFFKVTDESFYRRMVSSPTHLRILDDNTYLITRYIHNFFVKDAKKWQEPIFEYNQIRNAINYVEEKLKTMMRI
jgi:2-phosphoglycerate kinase